MKWIELMIRVETYIPHNEITIAPIIFFTVEQMLDFWKKRYPLVIVCSLSNPLWKENLVFIMIDNIHNKISFSFFDILSKKKKFKRFEFPLSNWWHIKSIFLQNSWDLLFVWFSASLTWLISLSVADALHDHDLKMIINSKTSILNRIRWSLPPRTLKSQDKSLWQEQKDSFAFMSLEYTWRVL
jgi:hypothetical protein